MHRAVPKWTHSLLVIVVAVAVAAWPRPSPAAPLRADPSASELVIRASKRGLFSVLAHDHQFTPARWQAEVDFDPRRPEAISVEVRIDAATLHDSVPRLTQSIRDHVDRKTAGPEVLDAQRFPEIRFSGESSSARPADGGLDGVLHGELSLHGTRRPLDVPFHALAAGPGYRVSGSVRVRQTDFGMTPYSTARGSIGVDDELQVEFVLVLVPAPSQAGALSHLGPR